VCYIYKIGGNRLTITPIIADIDNIIKISSKIYNVKRQGSKL